VVEWWTTLWVWRRCLPQTEEFSGYAPDCATIVANRWQEESKRRYEELTHQWLELAEQRQRGPSSMFVCNTTGLWEFPRRPSGRDLEHGERAMCW